MQLPKALGAGLPLVLILAACSGSPTPTQGPGGATQGPGGATQAPGGATQGPGATTSPGGATTDPGGGNTGGGSGKVTYTVTGSVQKSGELPFFAFGSRFDRTGPAGLALNFSGADESGSIFSVVEVNGAHSVSLIDEAHGLSWGNCATFDVQATATSATGRFECSNGFGTSVTDGSMVSNVQISGTFEARA